MEKKKTDESDLVSSYKTIVICPGYLGGRPALLGKRISVSQILEDLASGMTRQDMFDAYEITEEQISEALRFASELAGDSDVVGRRKSA